MKFAHILHELRDKRGLEIGGPSDIFEDDGILPVYALIGGLDGCNFSSQTVWHEKVLDDGLYRYRDGKKEGRLLICEASDLGAVLSGSYDFVLASHVLEHIANPIKAVREWFRVLREGGVLLVVVPDRVHTFDHRRPVTRLEHLYDDFERDVREDDLTHLPEVLGLHDLAMDPRAGDLGQFERRSRHNFTNRCFHHHVFDAELLIRIFDGIGAQVFFADTAAPHHIIMAVRKVPADVKPDNQGWVRTVRRSARRDLFLNTTKKILRRRSPARVVGGGAREMLCETWALFLVCARYLKQMFDSVFFRFFYHGPYPGVKIVLTHFDGYPFYREKNICGYRIRCGIGPLLEGISKFRAGTDFDVILVVNSADDMPMQADKYEALRKKYPFIKKILIRGNTGFDFGGYDAGYQHLRESGYNGDVLFVNSSARGPYYDDWLLGYSTLFHRNPKVGLCGISLNSHANPQSLSSPDLSSEKGSFAPHVQSFFMYTTMGVLSRAIGDRFPAWNLDAKKTSDVILSGELEFSRRILSAGYGIRSKLAGHLVYFKGEPWRGPIGETRGNRFYRRFANKI